MLKFTIRALSPDNPAATELGFATKAGGAAAQGFSGREIAQALGRSEVATRALMCRARVRLRTELEEGAP